jgi:hypothetical protein
MLNDQYVKTIPVGRPIVLVGLMVDSEGWFMSNRKIPKTNWLLDAISASNCFCSNPLCCLTYKLLALGNIFVYYMHSDSVKRLAILCFFVKLSLKVPKASLNMDSDSQFVGFQNRLPWSHWDRENRCFAKELPFIYITMSYHIHIY